MSDETLKQDIVRDLDRLPPEALHEVRDFIVSLGRQRRTNEEKGGLLEAAGCLSGTPLSAEEIETALYGETDPDE
jgi:hypothetical protein